MIHRRARKTRPSVILLDRVSRGIITFGGLGVIIAVFLVFVFLSSVVGPLFKRGNLSPLGSIETRWKTGGEILELDEFKTSGIAGLKDNRSIVHFFVGTGQEIQEIPLFDAFPTSFYFDHLTGAFVSGFEDGSTQSGKIAFKTSFYEPEQLPGLKMEEIERGAVIHEDGVAEKTKEGQVRIIRLIVEKQDPLFGLFREPVIRLDRVERPTGSVVAGFYEGGAFFIRTVSKKMNFLTGMESFQAEERDFKVPGIQRRGSPDYFYLLSFGDEALLLWKDGSFLRLNLVEKNAPQGAASSVPPPVEEVEVLEEGNLFALLAADDRSGKKDYSNAQITKATMLIGRSTLLVGDSFGGFSSWHVGRDNEKRYLLCSHFFQGPAGVSSISTSTRKRMVSVGYEDGSARVYYLTSEKVVAEEKPFPGNKVAQMALSPKDDGIVFVDPNGSLRLFKLDEGYPEFSLKAIFMPLLYEGNARPEHIWQSSSGTDAFEPKFGLMPLVFGTLKATFYSLLFGVPIALLAAIYTSEFLHPDHRARIKPLIEIMASLPSVVLGFLAALVFAPFAERVVPSILFGFFSIPFAFFLCGFIVQFLHKDWFLRLSQWRFYILLGIALPLGVLLAIGGGPIMERALFAGDLKAWLNTGKGGAWPGWFLILLPLGVLSGAYATVKLFQLPSVKVRIGQREWLKLLVGGLFALCFTLGFSFLLQGIGLDTRKPFPLVGNLLGTYVQRNSLVVGFLMGFAIIPIIYTIADDALKSVPQSLRAAALSLGATPWQTTVRVVIPTAMSGLFSAVMIGFGRAVGETMIVLMATGNTPVLEWNPFNGFRTLSANIAVELPEAVVGSTHYRILFLAALTLFVITFVVNTIAEIQRLRFREKSYQL